MPELKRIGGNATEGTHTIEDEMKQVLALGHDGMMALLVVQLGRIADSLDVIADAHAEEADDDEVD